MENYKIWFDEGEHIVRMLWTGYANTSQFREGTNRMLAVLEEQQVACVLGDITEMVLISQEDQQWLLDRFLPLAIRSGFRALALLQPRHYFNKVAVETVAYKVNSDKLQIRFFEAEPEALTWLRLQGSHALTQG